MANPFVHVELASTDVSRAKSFFSELFGWQLEDMPLPEGAMPDMTYTLIKVGEGTGGGMMQHPMPGAPSAWIPYVLVDNLESSTAKAAGLGGKVIKEITTVKDKGRFSLIMDPTGAVIGLWEMARR